MSARLKTLFIPVWKEAPFLRAVVPLMIGIIAQWYIQFSIQILIIAALLLLFTTILLYRTRYKTTFRLGVVFSLVFMVFGCWLTVLKNPVNWNSHISKHYYPGETVLATLEEPTTEKVTSFKTTASVKLIDSNNNYLHVAGNIIVYVSIDSGSKKLDYGSTIMFARSLLPITSAGNPGGFDYKRYAAFNHLYYQVFLKKGDYRVLNKTSYNPIRKSLFLARLYAIHTFQKYVPGKVEAGMAEALLLGFKGDLDKQLVESYANTGVVHIIAISGMHLGLIYGLLFFVLKPLEKKKYGKILKAILIIAALWMFSVLTGAAPSITRSALMFTVIIFGSSFSKTTTIYNSLAISAIALLLYDPFNLWDVGFQLSYAALTSIAVLGKPLSAALYVQNKLLQKIWQLMAVTIAAQAFTLPLVLYHFHQFPISFLLSNLIAVPLSSLILYALIALVLFSMIPYIGAILGWCSFYCIKAMNLFIIWVEAIPHSRIDNIYFSLPHTLVTAILVMAFCWWLLQRNSTALLTFLSSTFLLIVLLEIQFYQSLKQQKLIVYNVPKTSAMDIMNGRQFSFIGDTILQQKNFLQNFHLLPSRIQHRVSFNSNIIPDSTAFNLLQLGKYRVLILDKSPDVKHFKGLTADYLLVTKNCHTKPYMLLKNLLCKTVVLDGSCNVRYLQQWKNATDSLHLRLHSVQQQGAFVIDF